MEIVNITLEQGATTIERGGIGYDLKQAIEYDIPMIIRGATEYHKEAFEEHYVKESITPW